MLRLFVFWSCCSTVFGLLGSIPAPAAAQHLVTTASEEVVPDLILGGQDEPEIVRDAAGNLLVV